MPNAYPTGPEGPSTYPQPWADKKKYIGYLDPLGGASRVSGPGIITEHRLGVHTSHLGTWTHKAHVEEHQAELPPHVRNPTAGQTSVEPFLEILSLWRCPKDHMRPTWSAWIEYDLCKNHDIFLAYPVFYLLQGVYRPVSISPLKEPVKGT